MSRRGHVPRRTCVGCGQVAEQPQLWRLQWTEQGIDLVERPGRGRSAYVHPSANCIRGLVRSRLLARSLRRSVTAGDKRALAERLELRLAGEQSSARKS
ncbi:MAG: YlxR family protein [Candidatus Dadabacteria bacterium]|nr:MAG: YlxR family protein [Candidatus Dadabacteria bacterium]